MPEPAAEERRRWLDPAAVQAATAGMPGREEIATRLAATIPWLGPDAARTVASLALLALRDAGLEACDYRYLVMPVRLSAGG